MTGKPWKKKQFFFELNKNVKKIESVSIDYILECDVKLLSVHTHMKEQRDR